MNYNIIEKFFLAIMYASQKLWHYMLTHTIWLITQIAPLKYFFSKATLIGGLAKWVMILSEFDIENVKKKAIKGHEIFDQLA